MDWLSLKYYHHPVKRYLARTWDFFTGKIGMFLIGVGAIAIGSYQFYINKPILKYVAGTSSFISSKNDNQFKVIVKDKEFKDLYQTNITLINTGEQALAGSDVSKIGHDPIRIIIPQGADVVHYTIDKNQTSPSVSAKLTEYNGDIIIGFDFLNPDKQITVTVLHEHNTGEFYVTGSAVNVNEIKPAWTDKQIFYVALGCLGVIYIFSILISVLTQKMEEK